MGFKVLGQAAPTQDTDTDVYAVPAGRQSVVSTITVANRDEAEATFRLAVRPGGAALSDEHFVAFDLPIDGNALYTFTIGVTLDEDDVVTVRASTGDLSVSLFGQEIG